MNTARKRLGRVERKRARFQLLYETGRLCGYRAATIKLMLDGETPSEVLAAGALAHLDACASCRCEHRIDGESLRKRLASKARLTLLPWLTRLGRLDAPGGRDHGRLLALLGSGAAAGKLAAGAATVALLAGGTLGASRLLSGQPRHRYPQPRVLASPRATPGAPTHTGTAMSGAAGFPRHARAESRPKRNTTPLSHRAAQEYRHSAADAGAAGREFGPESTASAGARPSAPTSSSPPAAVSAVREFGFE